MTENTERIHPENLPAVVLAYVETLEALVSPLWPTSDPGGYLIDEPPECRFTERAYRLAKKAHEYAVDAGAELWAVAGTIRPSNARLKALDNLAYEAGYAFAAVAGALGWIQGATVPTAVIGGVRRLLRDVEADVDRALAEAEEVAHV